MQEFMPMLVTVGAFTLVSAQQQMNKKKIDNGFKEFVDFILNERVVSQKTLEELSHSIVNSINEIQNSVNQQEDRLAKLELILERNGIK